MSQTKHVLIVGGGLAGISCAEALSHTGVKLTLLEARPILGGRASSFIDFQTQEQLDNCQHVSLGCCTAYEQFCQRMRISSLFHHERLLTFYSKSHGFSRFPVDPLPSPLHLTRAFAGLKHLTFGQKLQLTRSLFKLMRARGDQLNQSFEDWLKQNTTHADLKVLFWDPVVLSALSETIDRVSLGYVQQVFWLSFLAHHNGLIVQIPKTTLSELYDQHCGNCLQLKKVTIKRKARVRDLLTDGHKMTGVELRNGAIIQADHLVLALPHYATVQLLENCQNCQNGLNAAQSENISLLSKQLTALEDAPISSVHLWYDKPLTSHRHVVFVNQVSQWLFNRQALLQEPSAANGYYYQVVISASHLYAQRTQAELIQAVVKELEMAFPESGAAVLRSRMVTEQRAVFSPTPQVDTIRPTVDHLGECCTLAGDWTQTGWPSTMEGAVRSGLIAAQCIAERWGLNGVPTIPKDRISLIPRLLFGR